MPAQTRFVQKAIDPQKFAAILADVGRLTSHSSLYAFSPEYVITTQDWSLVITVKRTMKTKRPAGKVASFLRSLSLLTHRYNRQCAADAYRERFLTEGDSKDEAFAMECQERADAKFLSPAEECGYENEAEAACALSVAISEAYPELAGRMNVSLCNGTVELCSIPVLRDSSVKTAPSLALAA